MPLREWGFNEEVLTNEEGQKDEEQGISLKNPPPIVSSSTFGTIYYSGKKPISGRYKINFPRQLRYQGTKIDKQDRQST